MGFRKPLQERIAAVLPPVKAGYAWNLQPSASNPEVIFVIELVKIDANARKDDNTVVYVDSEHFYGLNTKSVRNAALTVLRRTKVADVDSARTMGTNPAFGFYVSMEDKETSQVATSANKRRTK